MKTKDFVSAIKASIEYSDRLLSIVNLCSKCAHNREKVIPDACNSCIAGMPVYLNFKDKNDEN